MGADGFTSEGHSPQGMQQVGNSKPALPASQGSATALSCIVNAEIGAVLAVMRRNARWGTRYMAGHDDQHEDTLIHSLKLLRRRIFSWRDPWQTINPSLYFRPFLEVIRSDETGAPITGAALSAVYKILSLELLNASTAHVEAAMHAIVDSVTSCRFEVTDPESEEIVLMKILQVLLACVKTGAGTVLSNGDVLNVVHTCFRIVQQAKSKGSLLQRSARQTMQELVQTIFSRLPQLSLPTTVPSSLQPEQLSGNSAGHQEEGRVVGGSCSVVTSHSNGFGLSDRDSDALPPVEGQNLQQKYPPVSTSLVPAPLQDVNAEEWVGDSGGPESFGSSREPYGVLCIVEIFQFLCSLLNVEDSLGPDQRLLPSDEDALFALGLINSSLELGGESFGHHPELLALVQDELCRNLIRMGLSRQPSVLSLTCSIVLNLYHHLRQHLRLQLEAFFSFVIIRLVQGKDGATYQEQELALEALVDFCRQPCFMAEMYANFDCDITCSNIFEDLGNLLSRSAFPVNCPLSAMHVLALEGLLAVIHSVADRLDNSSVPVHVAASGESQEYEPFWSLRCENYSDPQSWVHFVRRCKYIKRRLMIGADHFNRDPKKGLEFLQARRLLPEKLDARSVACFFRYTTGLDKGLLGDFLGDPDEFCLDVLTEFARTFDFADLSLDGALRSFLESFRLPGEAQKIARVLDAFAERYYEQSSGILANKDAAFVLAYSVIILNTDQHNVHVKRRMSEEDFIKNNRSINGGADLPRELLSELFHSIARHEIRVSYDNGPSSVDMTYSRWVDLVRRSRTMSPYIECDAALLDLDMFSMISGSTIAAISVVFDNAEEEEVQKACVDGFLAVAKIAASNRLHDVLDDLAVSLCKLTTLLNPTRFVEEPAIAFGGDTKVCMAAVAVFTIANKFGDYIRSGWRNILDCILRLHKLGLLASRIPGDVADDGDSFSGSGHGKSVPGSHAIVPAAAVGLRRKSSSLMSRFSQLLSLESDEPRLQPTEQQLAAHQRTLKTIEACHIDNIFTDSKFLPADSLMELVKALINPAGESSKGHLLKDEDTSVFCLELLIAITLNNRDRILLLWQGVYEHMARIIQSSTTPSLLAEKAVFGLLHICQRLLPYKENLSEELLQSLQLILKLDARVADELCERITQELMQLVKANAGHIQSAMGWRTITALLTITARHPEASDPGFEALVFIMADGVHMMAANYVLCLDAAQAFAESRTGGNDKSMRALDLLAGSVSCLVQWTGGAGADCKPGVATSEYANMAKEGPAEMWLRLAQGIKKVCLDQREEVRNYALSALQRCITAAEDLDFSPALRARCLEQVVFVMLEDLLDIARRQTSKDYRNIEGTLYYAMKLMSKVFLQFLGHLSALPNFETLWLAVLGHMEKYLKVTLRGRVSDRLEEQVPEILKNMLLVMHDQGFLSQRSSIGGDSLWESTWRQVKLISPSFQSDMFVAADVPSVQHLTAVLEPSGNVEEPVSELSQTRKHPFEDVVAGPI